MNEPIINREFDRRSSSSSSSVWGDPSFTFGTCLPSATMYFEDIYPFHAPTWLESCVYSLTACFPDPHNPPAHAPQFKSPTILYVRSCPWVTSTPSLTGVFAIGDTLTESNESQANRSEIITPPVSHHLMSPTLCPSISCSPSSLQTHDDKSGNAFAQHYQGRHGHQKIPVSISLLLVMYVMHTPLFLSRGLLSIPSICVPWLTKWHFQEITKPTCSVGLCSRSLASTMT